MWIQLVCDEEFGPDVVRDGPEAVEADLLDVDAAHAWERVAHDSGRRVLVAGLVGPRSEGSAEAIESTTIAVGSDATENSTEPGTVGEAVGLQ